MGRDSTRAQGIVIDRDFIDYPCKIICPAVAGRTDGPISIVYLQRAQGGSSAGDLNTIAIELPIGPVVSANQMDPIAAAQVTGGDRIIHVIEIGTNAICKGG